MSTTESHSDFLTADSCRFAGKGEGNVVDTFPYKRENSEQNRWHIFVHGGYIKKKLHCPVDQRSWQTTAVDGVEEDLGYFSLRRRHGRSQKI